MLAFLLRQEPLNSILLRLIPASGGYVTAWYQSRFGVKHYINKLNLLKNAFLVRYELVAHIRTILEEYQVAMLIVCFVCDDC